MQAASTLPVFFLSALAQLMATVCTSHPRLDICVAVQIGRNTWFRNGASVVENGHMGIFFALHDVAGFSHLHAGSQRQADLAQSGGLAARPARKRSSAR
nr:hypothetical protein [Mesorhizobium sp. AR02]